MFMQHCLQLFTTRQTAGNTWIFYTVNFIPVISSYKNKTMSRKILIPVDGSEGAQEAFNFYVDNLLHLDEDEVLLVHVHQTPHLSAISFHEPLSIPAEEWTKKIKEHVKKSQDLMNHYEMLCEGKKIKKHTVIESGRPGEAICHAAKEHSASMIVMGSRGQNAIRRTFVGSVSDYVLHHAHIPVTVVPVHKEHHGHKGHHGKDDH